MGLKLTTTITKTENYFLHFTETEFFPIIETFYIKPSEMTKAHTI